MPPKAKFTKEEIISAALSIVERDGAQALTARSLGKELGSSARPIFTIFESMNDLSRAVHERANAVYGNFVEQGLKEDLAFRGVGKAYIRFAAERPRLFQLLFMQEQAALPDKTKVLSMIEEHYEEILTSIEQGYGTSRETALDLYFHLWVYSHGIAVLIATKVCAFSEEQITENIGEIFKSLFQKYKAEGRI